MCTHMPRITKSTPPSTSAVTSTEPLSVQNILQLLTPKFFGKILGFIALLAVAIFVLSIVLASLNTARSKGSFSLPMSGVSGLSVTSEGVSYGMKGGAGMGAPVLSARNVALSDTVAYPGMPTPYPVGTTGNTAEQFEVTDYNASIETAKLEAACDAVSALKGLSYVIFENAHESTQYCSYTFKVEHAYVSEILKQIEALDPSVLSENTYTIKAQLDDFTNQTDILEKKRASIDETLETALLAYDEITSLATKTQNAESLAAIITSKVALIERLTQERININQQLEYLSRAKAEQLDRLSYTYFHVSITEKLFINTTELSDSWHQATKMFIDSINRSAQIATLSLLQFIASVLVYLSYLLILIVVAKFVWKFGLYVWKR